MKNKIPTYTVCGFIDSGKTSFIKKSITDKNYTYGIIQFEHGDEKIDETENIKVLQIPYRGIKNNIRYISENIYTFLNTHNFDEIWIEVNGIMDFKILDDIFHKKFDKYNRISKILNFKKTMYIGSKNLVTTITGEQNPRIIEQIQRSSIGIINAFNTDNSDSIKYLFKSFNESINISDFNDDTDNIVDNKYIPQPVKLIVFALIIGYGYYLLKNLIPSNIIDINTIVTSLFGIILQSFPFLLLGVIISTIIQIFVPQNFIDSHFPKDPLLGILFSSLVGFIFPVCDCATIPVFRGLVKKGLPVSAAISFMIATPVVNPVVIISTYSAYNGNWKIVFLRCGLGFLCSLIIGLIFTKIDTSDILKLDMPSLSNCSTYANPSDPKAIQFIKHCQGEFLNVAKYLVLGGLISSTIQVIMSNFKIASLSYGTVVSIIIMMLLGFLLSLCSSSDAIIARSLGSNFPFAASLAFLVYGPMIDLKNVILLSSSFKKKFIVKLTCIITIVCFLVLLFLEVL